ncbi:hypothetical protein ASPCAL01850 [Aspergillus calidoustus]|uniref:Uncharacterized protein n=1 Tax=Aspergillus calidoustus TaxID=454130 RepID=A0A0U5GQU9_ASPCI|nr:hypothetical protein ASPCAL01850 [Aspergillus calidoustus]
MPPQPTVQRTETMSLEIRTTATKPGAPPVSIVFAHNHPNFPKGETIPLSPGSPYKVSCEYEVKITPTPKQAQETRATNNPPSPAATRAPSSTATKAVPTSHGKHQHPPARASSSATQSTRSGIPARNASSTATPATKTKQAGVAPSVTTAPRANANANGPILSRTKSEATRAIYTRAAPAATDAARGSCKNDSRSTSSSSSSVRYPSTDDHDCYWCDCPKLPLPSGLIPTTPLAGEAREHSRHPVGVPERSMAWDARYSVVRPPEDILPPGPEDEYECVRVTQRRVHINSKTVRDLSGPQWVHQVASWTESKSRDQNNNLHFVRESHNLEQILR